MVQFSLRFITLAVLIIAAQQAWANPLPDALDRTVKIFGAGGLRGLESYSTGFLVSPEGHIATVWNHVLDVEPVTVVLNDGRRFDAKITGAYPEIDLAILKIDQEGRRFPAFDLEDIPTAGPGDRIYALTNMYKVATGDESVSVQRGVISAVSQLEGRSGRFKTPYDGNVYIFDAITNNPGSAGGIVINSSGKPIGIIGREIRNALSNTWVNYAIPLNDLKKPIQEIITGKSSEDEDESEIVESSGVRPESLGIVMFPDVVPRTPAYIARVLPGSTAATLGLQPEDLIVFVNDELVQATTDFVRSLQQVEPEDEVRLVVRRGEQLLNLTLKVPKQE
ncbi:S1C family serine protease [Calycomorphotria hydatis]|uniref:Serine protease HtrA n=1 Tax=Calycomorphotria hydatis TaxID=2528027 RepID=A0A517TAG4_9PLAN|nr:S1C family serine protease [Calycomorphotria hydatis]QDT65371.1 Putative serine protease HtrA [Calycomorphotria hydatis]